MKEEEVKTDGKKLGVVQSYKRGGVWYYRAIMTTPKGFISGEFTTKQTAIHFLEWKWGIRDI